MGSSRTVVTRNGLSLVGLAVFAFGLVEAGVGIAQYYRPALGTSVKILNTDTAKAIAFHDAVVGVVALMVGLILGIAGVIKSRSSARAEEREAREDERTARVTTRQVAPRVIDLDANPSLQPMPATPEADKAPFAQRVWQCRLAVDLQQQRIMNEGIGAESKIDAELYVISLRNLVRAAKEAQAQTRSLAIWEAITTFGRAAGDADLFIAELENPDSSVGVDYGAEGTVVHVGEFGVAAARLTAAADQLANTTVGDLSNIRARSVQNSYSRTAGT